MLPRPANIESPVPNIVLLCVPLDSSAGKAVLGTGSGTKQGLKM
jgi:hypothetical protein